MYSGKMKLEACPLEGATAIDTVIKLYQYYDKLTFLFYIIMIIIILLLIYFVRELFFSCPLMSCA